MSLTDIAIRGLKPTDKPQKVSDGNGLYLLVTPKGKKNWRLRYFIQGRENMLSLGAYPQVSLKEARERCADARKLVSNGIDPSAEKKAKAQNLQTTFEKVALEWLDNQKPVWSAGYVKMTTQRLEKNIFPLLGKRPINEITPPELLAVLRKIEARGAVNQAHNVREMCSRVFRYAIATSRAERDTAADLRGALKAFTQTPRAALTEPKKIGGLMRAIDDFDGTFIVKNALQLLALTFLRPGEVRMGEWSEVDFGEKLWCIPVARMKMRREHIVPLSTQACELLQSLHALTGQEKLMFPGLRSRTTPISDATFIAALRRMGYAKDEMCAHGFRSMASTILNEQGYSADAIEKQLAHNPRNKIRGIYNRAEYLPERRRIMQDWADYLDQLRQNS